MYVDTGGINPSQHENSEGPDPTEPLPDIPASPYRLDENAPIVSMDIRMGKKHQNVDFDYEGFVRRAKDLHDMDDNDIAQLSINIRHRSRFTLTRGGYLPSRKHIDVKAHQQSTANKTFRHELQHAADDPKGRLNIGARYISGKLSAYMVNLMTPGILADDVTDTLHTKLPVISSEIYTKSFWILAGLATAGYVLNPMERRARKASRTKKQDIIIMERYKPLLATRVKRLLGALATSPIGGAGTFTIGSPESP